MKKLVVFSLVLLMAASAVFAQIADGVTMGGFGQAVVTPMSFHSWNDGDKSEVYTGASATTWGVGAPRIGFGITGNWEFVGVTADFQYGNGGLGTLDNAQIWVKPFSNDYLTVRAGQFVVDDIRGKIGNLNGGFDVFTVSQSEYEEDDIFSRFQAKSFGGFMLSSNPLEPLFIGLKIEASHIWGGSSQPNGELAADVWKKIQIGAGYNIEGIGHIRAQYVGGSGKFDTAAVMADALAVINKYYVTTDAAFAANPNNPTLWTQVDPTATPATVLANFAADMAALGAKVGKYSGNPSIEAAFALTAVENLLVDIGTKIYLPVEDEATVLGSTQKSKYTPGVQVNLGATFGWEALSLGLKVHTDFGSVTEPDGGDKSTGPFLLNLHFVPSYALDFATIGLDFGMEICGSAKDGSTEDESTKYSQLGFGAWIKKSFGNGSIQTGLALQLPQNDKDGKAKNHTVFSIPVLLEYTF